MSIADYIIVISLGVIFLGVISGHTRKHAILSLKRSLETKPFLRLYIKMQHNLNKNCDKFCVLFQIAQKAMINFELGEKTENMFAEM